MTDIRPDMTAAEVAVTSPVALAAMTKIMDAPGGPTRTKLWPHQRAILLALMRQRYLIVLKARQLGVTRVLALYVLWFIMAKPGVNALIVSIGEREAKAVKKHIKALWSSLPKEVRSAYTLGQDNETIFEVVHADGAHSKAMSLPSSDSAGRGETSHLVIMDEAAFYERSDERLATIIPTAADVGQVVMSSTANGIGGKYHSTWVGAPGNGWHPIFIAADGRPDRSEAWIETERARLEEKGAQEYPMTPGEAFLATGRCAFNVEALAEYLEHRCTEGLGTFRIERDATGVYAEEDAKGPWRVWEFRKPGRLYCITGDPCGGVGGEDGAAMAVYDVESWDQVAAYHTRVEPAEFARDMVRAGWLWAGRDGRPALLIPEANNHGAGVITLLREWHYPRIWTYKRLDQRRAQQQVEYGWRTTSSTRPQMFSALKEGISSGSLGIRDPEAIGEMFRFVVKVNASGTEREEADAGAHDDRVVTHAIAAICLQRPSAGVYRPGIDRLVDDDPYPGEDPREPDGHRPRISAVTGYLPASRRGFLA